jgi:hypothetical protein
MSKQETTAPDAPDNLTVAETHLGKVLAAIHRALARLDDPARAGDVQSSLRSAIAALETARLAHERDMTGRRAISPAQRVTTGVSPEIAAVIAAAVSVLFDRPFRMVSVQPVAAPVPHLNVWALEGRTQIFQSHKVR